MTSTISRRTLLGGGLGGVLALSTFALTGCSSAAAENGSGSASGKLDTITLADPSSTYTQLPILYGEQKGIWAKHSLQPKFETLDYNSQLSAVASGDLLFAFGATTSFLQAAQKGSPIRLVASAFRSKGPYWLIAKKGISKISQLKGKTLGTGGAGSAMETYAKVILTDNGLDPAKDLTLVPGGSTDQTLYTAVKTGQVDAVMIHQPYAALGELDGITTTLARGWEYLPKYHTGALISGTSTITKSPDVLKRALAAYFEIYTYTKAHESAYIPWLQKQLKTIDPRAVKAAIEQENDIWDSNPAIDLTAINESQKIEVAAGHQTSVFDPKPYIDTDLIPQKYVKPFSYPTAKPTEG